MKSPTVLLVEDQQLLRLGLSVSLEKLGCCQILGEAATGERAVSETHRLRPEIVLMDIGLPGMDGIEATWRIKQELPRTHVVMFTSRTTPGDITAALGAGADGYCTKSTSVEHIASAIETVMRGEVWLDPEIADMVVCSQTVEDDKTVVRLTEFELKILQMLKEGEDNCKIAARLETTTGSVALAMRNVVQQYMQKAPNAESGPRNELDTSNDWLTLFVENLNDGTIFADKYLVESLLGSGGVGAVFKAKHLYIDRYVALKLLRPELAKDRLAMRIFQREAIAIANVQHNNIVGVYDFGISANHEPFLVMEYVDGTDLAKIFKEQRLPTRRLLNLSMQVCAGLAEAHSKGIIHCDLKPSNILIFGSGLTETAKLVDFGLAQIQSLDSNVQSQPTDKFFICGTPLYMAPEQCAGQHLDARSDIYSLGCILYEGLTGVRIFQGKTSMETFAKQLQLTPPPMSTACPQGNFSSQLEICVRKLLEKDPADRPQTMKEVIMLLLSV